jgi:hypothetical protein
MKWFNFALGRYFVQQSPWPVLALIDWFVAVGLDPKRFA